MAESQFDSLVGLAKRDAAALRLLSTDEYLLSPAFFHAQQAIEKVLKAVLSAKGVNYPLTHDLILLKEALRRVDVVCPAPDSMLKLLTPFGVQAQYDEDIGAAQHMADIIASVDQSLSWCEVFRPTAR